MSKAEKNILTVRLIIAAAFMVLLGAVLNAQVINNPVTEKRFG